MKRSLLVVSVSLGLVQGFYLLHWFDRYNQSSKNAADFGSYRVEVARLDEVLTMSARLYAATGEASWRKRYLEHVEPLGKTLENTLNLAGDESAKKAISMVSEANDQLIAMEEQAFVIVAEGRLRDAFDLLNSPNYQAQKERYQHGLDRALDISKASVRGIADYHRSALILSIIAVFVSLVILTETWRRLSLAQQRETSRKIERALDQERHLSGLQRQFISMVSHEFRTPLAIIDGNAQELQRVNETVPPDQVRQAAVTIRTTVGRLTNHMESVLNLARLEEGHIKATVQDFNLSGLISEVVASHREANPDRMINVALDEMPKIFSGDSSLLGQAISNILSNALKYSEKETPVHLEAYPEGDEVVIAVHDKGIGISSDEVEKIGQKFFRATSSVGTAGSGVGLFFAKQIINLHRGRMELRSRTGAGSSFFIRLPRRGSIEAAQTASSSKDMGMQTLTPLPS